MLDTWADGHYVVDHPITKMLEARLTELHNLPSICTTKGMTAIKAVLYALVKGEQIMVEIDGVEQKVLVPGLVLHSTDLYPGTKDHLMGEVAKGYIRVQEFNPSDVKVLAHLLHQQTAQGIHPVVYTEGVGNSTRMTVADLKGLIRVTAEYGCYLVIDVTFTPFFQTSAPHVILIESMTKFAGADDQMTGGRISARQELLNLIKATRYCEDVRMSHQVAEYFLHCKMGIAKMRERYSKHVNNALQLSRLLETHQAVERVFYPGLESHPQHELLEQYPDQAAGGLFFFQLKGGRKAVIKLADKLANDCFHRLSVSLGSEVTRYIPLANDRFVEVFGGIDGVIRMSPGHTMEPEDLSVVEDALDQLIY